MAAPKLTVDDLRKLGLTVPDGADPEKLMQGLQSLFAPSQPTGPQTRGIKISAALAKSLSKTLGTDIKEGVMATEDLQGLVLANSLGKQKGGGKITGADYNKTTPLPSEVGPKLGNSLDQHIAKQSDTSLADALTARSKPVMLGATPATYAQSGTRAPGESLEDFQIRQKSLTAQRIASNPDVIAAKDNTQKEAAAVAAGKTESERRANLPQGIAEAILNPDSGAVVGYTRKPLDLEQAGDTALKAKEGELRAKYGYKQGSGFPDAKSEEAFTKAFEETRLATRAGENDKALQAAVDAGTVDPTAASLVPTKTGFEATVVDAETGKVAIPLIKGPNMVGRDAKVSEMLTSGAAGVFQPDKNEINIGRSFSPIVTKAAGSGGYGVDTLPSPAKLAETLLHESGHAFVKANPGAIDIPAATPERTADYAKGFLAVVKGGTAPDAAKVGEEDFLQGDSLKRFSLGGVVSRAATGIAAGLTKPVFGPLTSAAPGFASINTPAPSGGSISDIFRNLMASTN